MRQAVVTGAHQVEIHEVASPPLPAGGIRIRATLCGVSTGTEMAIYRGTIPNLHNGRWGYWNQYPIYPGYEMVGEVTEVDSGASDVAVGDRVVALAPHGTEGVATPDVYVPIPDGVSDEAATVAVLGATTLHGMHRAQVRHAESVLVLGFGVVGALSAAHARHSGAGVVIVADPLESRRAMATKLGFEQVLDASSPEFVDQVYALTKGRGVDQSVKLPASKLRSNSASPALPSTGGCWFREPTAHRSLSILVTTPCTGRPRSSLPGTSVLPTAAVTPARR